MTYWRLHWHAGVLSVAGSVAGMTLATTGAMAQSETPAGRIIFLGWTEGKDHSVWLSGVDPGEFFVVFPETGERVDSWTQPDTGLHLTVSPIVRENGGTHNLFAHIRTEYAEYDNFVDSADQHPGGINFPDHWNRPDPELPDLVTPELRPNPDTVTPGLRPLPDTVTPGLRPNPDLITPGLRPLPETVTPELRPNPDTVTPGLRPDPDTVTPELRPNPDTVTPGLRPDPDTVTPELHPDPEIVTPELRPVPVPITPEARPDPDTVTPEVRPDPDTPTPEIRPDPDTVTPGLRPDPDTVTPGLRPDPDTVTPGLRPDPDTVTPGLRPDPDTVTPGLRPDPDTVTPGLRPDPDTVTPGLRPDPDTVTPGLRPDPDTVTPGLRPDPDTVTPGLRPDPDTVTPGLRPDPDTVTPGLRPDPDTVTPGLRPDPDTVTPGLRPDPDTVTPGLRPDPDTVTPGLRPDPDTVTPGLRPDPDTVTPGLRPDPDTVTPGLRPDPDTVTPGLRPDPDTVTPGLRPDPDTVTPGLRPDPDTVTPGLRPDPDVGGPTVRPIQRPHPETLPPIAPTGVVPGRDERRPMLMTTDEVCRAGREGRLRGDPQLVEKACRIAANARRRWTAWGEWSYSTLKDDRSGARTRGSANQYNIGLDRWIDKRTVAGLAIQFGNSDYKSFNGGMRQQADSITVKPYMVHRMANSDVVLDASIGFNFGEYEQHVLMLSGKHDSFTLSGTVGMSAQRPIGSFLLRPRLSWSYASIWHDNYVLQGQVGNIDLRVLQGDARYDYGAVATSLEISRPFRSDDMVITPYVEGGVDFAYLRPNGGRVLGPDLRLIATTPATGSVRFGTRIQLRGNVALIGSGEYYGIGSGGLSSWQWRGNLSFRF